MNCSIRGSQDLISYNMMRIYIATIAPVFHLSKNLFRTVFLEGASSTSSFSSGLMAVFNAQRMMEFTCFLSLALSVNISANVFLTSSSVTLESLPLKSASPWSSLLWVLSAAATALSSSWARSCAYKGFWEDQNESMRRVACIILMQVSSFILKNQLFFMSSA